MVLSVAVDMMCQQDSDAYNGEVIRGMDLFELQGSGEGSANASIV